MRRLYSTFARGSPAIGLLLIRVVAGITAIAHGVGTLGGGPGLASTPALMLWMALGSLLLIGLWTPVIGAILAAAAFWNAFSHPEYRSFSLVLGALGIAITLIGPGRWSLDARLFGWRRLEIRVRKRS